MTEFRQSPPTEHQIPPSSEWDFLNGAGRPGARPPIPDLSPLFFFLDTVRRAVPQELQDQFNALVREVLLTIRALIDWYLERLDKPELAPQVEDIPID